MAVCFELASHTRFEGVFCMSYDKMTTAENVSSSLM